jgi:hypothetical protein
VVVRRSIRERRNGNVSAKRLGSSTLTPMVRFAYLLTIILVVAVLGGCVTANKGTTTAPPATGTTEEHIVVGKLAAVGDPSTIILMKDKEELRIPVGEGFQMTRDGKPLNGLELRANLQVRVTIKDGKAVKMEVLTPP